MSLLTGATGGAAAGFGAVAEPEFGANAPVGEGVTPEAGALLVPAHATINRTAKDNPRISRWDEEFQHTMCKDFMTSPSFALVLQGRRSQMR